MISCVKFFYIFWQTNIDRQIDILVSINVQMTLIIPISIKMWIVFRWEHSYRLMKQFRIGCLFVEACEPHGGSTLAGELEPPYE